MPTLRQIDAKRRDAVKSTRPTGLRQTTAWYRTSHRPATRGAGAAAPLRPSRSGQPRAVAQLQHRANSTPARLAEPATKGFDPPSLTPSLQTAFTQKWVRLVKPHSRPAPAAAHPADPERRPPPDQQFRACHNERLTAAGYPSRRRQTRQVD
jgi:hypothetical protein